MARWNHSSPPPKPPSRTETLRRKLANATDSERAQAVRDVKKNGSPEDKEALRELGYDA